MIDSNHAAIATRIAEALERIAAAMESAAKPKMATQSSNDESIPDEWIALVGRVLAGEKVTHIAKDIGITPSGVRTKVLKAFERRNPAKYAELREMRDYGCIDHPSMRLLVSHREIFGF